LVKLLKGIPCKLNIISLNDYTNAKLKAPSEQQLNWFANKLAENGIAVTVRKSRGSDICGACGQLAGKVNKG
jgi:23S rRNA (adenine2503-C2)-methyltransferase